MLKESLSSRIDTSKLLGFHASASIDGENDSTGRLSRKTGQKTGQKTGTKPGIKAGLKIGSKEV